MQGDKKKQNKYNEGLLPGYNKTSHSLRSNLGSGAQKWVLRREFAFHQDCHPCCFFPPALFYLSKLHYLLCVCVFACGQRMRRMRRMRKRGVGGGGVKSGFDPC